MPRVDSQRSLAGVRKLYEFFCHMVCGLWILRSPVAAGACLMHVPPMYAQCYTSVKHLFKKMLRRAGNTPFI